MRENGRPFVQPVGLQFVRIDRRGPYEITHTSTTQTQRDNVWTHHDYWPGEQKYHYLQLKFYTLLLYFYLYITD